MENCEPKNHAFVALQSEVKVSKSTDGGTTTVIQYQLFCSHCGEKKGF